MAYLTGAQYVQAATAAFERTARELLGIHYKKDFSLDLQSHDQTAAVAWRIDRSDPNRPVYSVRLFLPAMRPGALLTRKDADALTGFWVHEMAHVLYTDLDAWGEAVSEGQAFANLVNGLEDIRIEAAIIGAAKVPGARQCLNEITERHVWRSPITPETVNDKANAAALMAYIGRERINGYALPRAADMLVALSPKNRSFVTRVLGEVAKAQSTRDIVDIVRDNFKGLAGQGDQGQGQGDQGQGDQGQGDQGQGDQGQGDQGQGDQGQGQGDQGQGQGDQGQGTNGNREPGTGAGRGVTDGDEFSAIDPSRDEILGGDGADVVQGMADKANNGPLSRTESNVLTRSAGMGVTRIRPFTEATYDRLANSVKGVGAIRAQVRRMVRSPDRFGWINRLDRGRFDPKASGRVRTGSGDYYRRADEQEGHKTAVTIVCDMSGSMGSKTRGQAAMAIQVAQAVAAASCPVEVLGFTGSKRLVLAKPANKPVAQCKGELAALDQSPGSSTPLGEAIVYAANSLSKLDGSARMLFVLTDGFDGHGPDNVRAAVSMAHSLGIIVVGVIIDDFSIERAGFDTMDAAINCPDADELSVQVLKALADQLENVVRRKTG